MVAITKLGAVNEMLLAIGQAPVNTLEVAGIRDVSVAALILDNVSREVQTDGHSFNTFISTLPLDPAGKILLPQDALFCDPVDPRLEAAPVEDNDVFWLYDMANETYVWDEPVKCTLVRLLPFESLPQHARRYITAMAKLRFQASAVGSSMLNSLFEQEVGMAYASFRRAELLQSDNNILTDGGSNIARNRYRRHR